MRSADRRELPRHQGHDEHRPDYRQMIGDLAPPNVFKDDRWLTFLFRVWFLIDRR